MKITKSNRAGREVWQATWISNSCCRCGKWHDNLANILRKSSEKNFLAWDFIVSSCQKNQQPFCHEYLFLFILEWNVSIINYSFACTNHKVFMIWIILFELKEYNFWSRFGDTLASHVSSILATMGSITLSQQQLGGHTPPPHILPHRQFLYSRLGAYHTLSCWKTETKVAETKGAVGVT